jgi:hypothetical protein
MVNWDVFELEVVPTIFFKSAAATRRRNEIVIHPYSVSVLPYTLLLAPQNDAL